MKIQFLKEKSSGNKYLIANKKVYGFCKMIKLFQMLNFFLDIN